MTSRRVIAGVAIAAGLSAWIVGGGIGGLLYTIIYALAAVPGLPLGFRLFGRRQPAGWVAGALIGYVLTAFGIWLVIAAGVPSAATFSIVWFVITGASWAVLGRQAGAPLALPPWDRRASLGLGLVLLLTLALSVPPFARVGARDAQGNRLYRAYFTADFVWHTALTAELSKFSMPPRNPYLASEPIHYYWTYFLVPAAVSRAGPPALRDVQACLKVNAVLTGLLLMSSVFILAWAAIGRPLAVTAAVLLALLAGSFEGTYEIYRLWSRGQGLGALRDTNVDAITAWHFGGHRIDGLPRCLWYVPQHSMAYALGLMALTAVELTGATASISMIAIEGIALAAATAINPFVGGIFAGVWGLAVVADAFRQPAPLPAIFRHGIAGIPVLLALIWCVVCRMVEGAGGALEFGFRGASLQSPLWSLFLSLGPVLIPAAAGCALLRPRTFRSLAPATILSAVALTVMYCVRLRVDVAWVPFRAGQLLLVGAPSLIAHWLWRSWERPALRAATTVTFVALLLLGLPTTIVDAYNSGDVTNRAEGAGFHWTGVLDPEQQQALLWIKRVTPADAIVQMEPVARDRDSIPGLWGEWWSLIPTFAERRMAGGLPISLMRVPEYQATSDRIRTMFATADAAEARAIARSLRISYVYVDGIDRAEYPGAAKFDQSPALFEPVFRRGPVAVYQVR